MIARQPLTPAQRQAKRRAKVVDLGLLEVRGIFLPPELHHAVKVFASRIAPLPIDKQDA